METIQDLLAPEKNNISINEDAKTGEVSVPGATVVNIQDLDHFLQVLQVGETNRHAANTKMNTESSRSHAILTVCFLIIFGLYGFLFINRIHVLYLPTNESYEMYLLCRFMLGGL